MRTTRPLRARWPLRWLREKVDPVRWDVCWHSLCRGEVRLALGLLIWPSGWSHSRIIASNECLCPTSYPGTGIGCPIHPEEVDLDVG